jgi:hypothetical protein
MKQHYTPNAYLLRDAEYVHEKRSELCLDTTISQPERKKNHSSTCITIIRVTESGLTSY